MKWFIVAGNIDKMKNVISMLNVRHSDILCTIHLTVGLDPPASTQWPLLSCQSVDGTTIHVKKYSKERQTHWKHSYSAGSPTILTWTNSRVMKSALESFTLIEILIDNLHACKWESGKSDGCFHFLFRKDLWSPCLS